MSSVPLCLQRAVLRHLQQVMRSDKLVLLDFSFLIVTIFWSKCIDASRQLALIQQKWQFHDMERFCNPLFKQRLFSRKTLKFRPAAPLGGDIRKQEKQFYRQIGCTDGCQFCNPATERVKLLSTWEAANITLVRWEQVVCIQTWAQHNLLADA